MVAQNLFVQSLLKIVNTSENSKKVTCFIEDTTAIVVPVSCPLLPVCRTGKRKTHRYCSQTKYLSC